jgi:hypothetical protein
MIDNELFERLIIGGIRGAIRCYLLKRKARCTENWTVGYVKQKMLYGVSKERLMEIFNEFEKYKESPQYQTLIDRCQKENLL